MSTIPYLEGETAFIRWSPFHEQERVPFHERRRVEGLFVSTLNHGRFMSPQAGFALQDQVVTRLRSAIPNVVRCVGAEDHNELIQDATAMAAKMMHNVEQAGKKVTAGNIAHYAIQHCKSGRRSVGYSNADVLAASTQLNGKSTVRFRLSQATIGYHKERLAQAIREFMGADILALVVNQPEWKSQSRTMREKHVRMFTN